MIQNRKQQKREYRIIFNRNYRIPSKDIIAYSPKEALESYLKKLNYGYTISSAESKEKASVEVCIKSTAKPNYYCVKIAKNQRTASTKKEQDTPRKEAPNMLEYNKVYTWDEIVKNYPNMYAIITDVVKEHEEIKRCKLLEIVSFEDEEKTCHEYKKAGRHFDCVRTTFSVPSVGVLI